MSLLTEHKTVVAPGALLGAGERHVGNRAGDASIAVIERVDSHKGEPHQQDQQSSSVT
jgi:hypothetical protein